MFIIILVTLYITYLANIILEIPTTKFRLKIEADGLYGRRVDQRCDQDSYSYVVLVKWLF